jgi:hypothetical protein
MLSELFSKTKRSHSCDRQLQAIVWGVVGGQRTVVKEWGEWTMKLERVNSNGTD